MRISRVETQWEDEWRCECGEQDESVSQITHRPGCPVEEPDNVNWPNAQIQRVVESIIRECDARRHKVDHLSSVHQELTDDEIMWTRQGSTGRFVLGLGRTTSQGQTFLDDLSGIVLKVDPYPRWGDTIPRSGNIDELLTWETAVETDTEEFFNESLVHAHDGTWIVYREAVPVHPTHRRDHKTEDRIWDRDRELIDPLVAAMQQNGWTDPDWKHGNIGVCPDGVPRMIDYGTGPERE